MNKPRTDQIYRMRNGTLRKVVEVQIWSESRAGRYELRWGPVKDGKAGKPRASWTWCATWEAAGPVLVP